MEQQNIWKLTTVLAKIKKIHWTFNTCNTYCETIKNLKEKKKLIISIIVWLNKTDKNLNKKSSSF